MPAFVLYCRAPGWDFYYLLEEVIGLIALGLSLFFFKKQKRITQGNPE
jgi:hypothetical protein